MEQERFNAASFTPPWVRAEHLQRFLFASAHLRGAVVVDCACGSGEGSRIFAEAGAARIHAFDISAEAIALTRERCAGHDSVVAEQADATALPLAAGVADVYVSFETFEHVPDQDAMLREAARVLKPGGLFITSTPNRSVYSPMRGRDDRPWNRFHVRELTTGEFSAKLSDVFESCELYGQNAAIPLLAGAAKHIGTFSPDLAVRFNQLCKLRWMLGSNLQRHRVRLVSSGEDYEYVVALCRTPRDGAKS